MNNTFNTFQSLHTQSTPLLIGNAWNAQSARIFEQAGFKAIATSSSAVAFTLGYNDGEEMSFEEYLFVIKRIAASVTIPFSVDLEGGYGRTADDVVHNIKTLHALGIAGINIEDSVVNDGKRSILDASSFANHISAITAALRQEDIDVFINLRSDPFLLGLPDPLNDSLHRIEQYKTTDVHGLFFPCVTQPEHIAALTKASPLPINVMCMPALPDFATLQQLGVQRISIGNFLNQNAYQSLANNVSAVLKQQSFQPVFG